MWVSGRARVGGVSVENDARRQLVGPQSASQRAAAANASTRPSVDTAVFTECTVHNMVHKMVGTISILDYYGKVCSLAPKQHLQCTLVQVAYRVFNRDPNVRDGQWSHF